MVTIYSNEEEVTPSVDKIKENITIRDEAEAVTLIHEIIH